MLKSTTFAIAALLIGAGAAGAAEPVVGSWKTASGETAKIAPCGNAYCITLQTGQFKGRQIGRMSGSGGSYSGEITDPAANKTYAGSAKVNGASMKLTGCALKIFCKSQTWSRR
ncbi:Uncharacterized conserved protein, DUF2147 family [Fulvimarina manganoxydans]|uniref:Uncharacterized conserved protein, DUF2147 family n=1 Tax=Fulvimarina manganoxydans TaxID=937218 RepID=A0A1W2E8Q0_9HYPH|nr:DUF2147 domain-containing protein [Fulvimarina manganoxydans]MCK5933919.1 DUF2147 domain-containing protein [Fulvimarina manganoxydans]MEE2953334.1 DUF2147 domain-containing protein [Pseudomonadota bacterium]SMD05686.1 Uncharacterized conserved protein, DUF2147 family [Fulvimarina manganoxydans]